MEFFKSKYYVSLQPIAPTSGIVDNTNQLKKEQLQRDMITIHKSGETFAYTVLELYCNKFPILKEYRLSKSVISKTWTPVTDLTCTRVRFLSDIVDGDFTDMFVNVYYHPESEFFVYLVTDSKTPEQNEFPSTLRIYMPAGVNQQAGLDALLRDGSMTLWTAEPAPRMSLLAQYGGRLSLKHTKLKPVTIDFDTMYPEEFKEVSAQIVQEVSDKEKTGLIILHGEPGTGKTNYLRWLSSQATREIVFVPPEMVAHLTSPDFVSFLLAHKGLTLIVEDAESTLSPRMGSERSIVSTILNLTDGLLGDALQCQFICTFNTALTNIDSALLRPGRLLVRQEFRKLDVTESNKYLKSVGSSERVDKPTSLAELMNLKALPVVSTTPAKKTFGFNNN